MSNLTLLWPDYIQPSISYTPTFSGGSWSTTYSLANVQTLSLDLYAETTNLDAASLVCIVDLKVARTIDQLAIGKHNATSAGTVVVTIATDSGFTNIVHTSPTLNLYPAGKTAEEMDGYNIGWYYRTGGVSARYVKFTFSDAANPDGKFRFARLLIGKEFQPATNTEYSSTNIAWEHNTSSEKSIGGRKFYNRNAPRRVNKFNVPNSNESEAFDTIFEMQRRLGIDGQTFFAFDPIDAGTNTTAFRQWQRSFLCTLRELSPIEYPFFEANQTAFIVEEVL